MFKKKKYKVNGKTYRVGGWSYIKNHNIREWAKNKERDYLAGVEKNEGKEGYVYIFDLKNGYYKVGRTKNVLQRLKALQAGNPGIKCVWSAHVQNTYEAESALHKMFKKKKVEREVFALERGDILAANNNIKSS